MSTFADAIAAIKHVPGANDVGWTTTAEHYSHGVYARQIHIPAGYVIVSHKHHDDHMSILASGRVVVTTDEGKRVLDGPAVIVIKAGVHHAIYAEKDAVWFCIHALDEEYRSVAEEILVMKES